MAAIRGPYHGEVLIEPDGSIRISWSADGYEAIHVLARFRPRGELEAFARHIADAALFNRTLSDLRVALRAAFPGAFDLIPLQHDPSDPHVVVRFHPPRGKPNPDE